MSKFTITVGGKFEGNVVNGDDVTIRTSESKDDITKNNKISKNTKIVNIDTNISKKTDSSKFSTTFFTNDFSDSSDDESDYENKSTTTFVFAGDISNMCIGNNNKMYVNGKRVNK